MVAISRCRADERQDGVADTAGASEFVRQQGHSSTQAFESAYPRPIVTVWRGPITDMLQVTHLSIVDGRFKYDPIFGYGYMFILNLLLDKYPVDGEKDKLIDATITALDLDPRIVRNDEADVKNWMAGKSEADVLAAPENAGASKVNKALADIKANDQYLHTRSGNIGIINMIDAVGLKPDNSTLTRWSDALGLRKRSLERAFRRRRCCPDAGCRRFRAAQGDPRQDEPSDAAREIP